MRGHHSSTAQWTAFTPHYQRTCTAHARQDERTVVFVVRRYRQGRCEKGTTSCGSERSEVKAVAAVGLGVIVDVELELLRVGRHVRLECRVDFFVAEVAVDDLKCFLVNVLIVMVLQEFNLI